MALTWVQGQWNEPLGGRMELTIVLPSVLDHHPLFSPWQCADYTLYLALQMTRRDQPGWAGAGPILQAFAAPGEQRNWHHALSGTSRGAGRQQASHREGAPWALRPPRLALRRGRRPACRQPGGRGTGDLGRHKPGRAIPLFNDRPGPGAFPKK
jgi:hypothetical protein